MPFNPGHVLDVLNAPAPRSSRALDNALREVEHTGILRATQAQTNAYVAATTVQAAAVVTDLSLGAVASLAGHGQQLMAQVPEAAPHLRAVLNSFAGVVVSEISSLSVWGRR